MDDVILQLDPPPEVILDMPDAQEIPLAVDGAYVDRRVNDYERLENKPRIEGVELIGDKAFTDLGMAGGDNVEFDHGEISVPELTAAQVAALLT